MGILVTLLVLVAVLCSLINPLWGTCAYIATVIIRPNEMFGGVMLPAIPVMIIIMALSTLLHAPKAISRIDAPPQAKSPPLLVFMVLISLAHLVIFPSIFSPVQWLLGEGAPTLLLLYYMTRHMTSPRRLAAGLTTAMASSTYMALDAFHAHYFRRDRGGQTTAPDGTVYFSYGSEWSSYHLHGLRLHAKGSSIWSNPNDFGLLINWAIVGALYYLRRSGSKLLNLCGLALAALLTWTLFLTGSRGGQLQLGITFWMFFVGGKRKALGIFLLVAALVGVMVVLPMVAPERADAGASKSERTELALAALRLFTWRPIIGVGFYRSAEMNSFKSLFPHNVYVQCLAEMGLLGSSIFFSLIYFLRRETSRAVKHFEERTETREEHNRAHLARCLGALQFSFTIFIAFSNQFLRYTFALVMSLAMALYRAMQRDQLALQEQEGAAGERGTGEAADDVLELDVQEILDTPDATPGPRDPALQRRSGQRSLGRRDARSRRQLGPAPGKGRGRNK